MAPSVRATSTATRSSRKPSVPGVPERSWSCR
jgi:hypothetical protein